MLSQTTALPCAQPRYAATLKDAFGAEAAPLQSAAVVNGWVDQATRGKITEIIDEGIARQASCGLSMSQGAWALHACCVCESVAMQQAVVTMP